MLSATLHLLLSSLDEVEHTGVTIEPGIYRHRPDHHAHRMAATLVGTPVMECAEQGLLLIIVFCQQIAVGRCENGTSEHTVRLAEGIHPSLVHCHGALQEGIDELLVVAVGQQR